MRTIPIILLLILSHSTSAQQVNNLKIEQPLLKDLFVWGDHIIAEKDHTNIHKFYSCDTISKQLIPLTIKGNSEVLYLAESNSFLFAIVKNQNTFSLISKGKTAQSWNSETLFQGFDLIREAKFVANDSLLLFITADKIHYKARSSGWQSILLNSLVDLKSLIFAYGSVPQHCLVTANSLYLGYDHGEWSGALIEIPFISKNNIVFKKGKTILEDNIKAICRTTNDTIWIATGLAHMAAERSGIYKYKNKSLQEILWSKPSLSLPKKSDLSAFCLNNKEEPLFVASILGVFKIESDKLKQVINANLYISYSMKDYSVGSFPEAMYADKNDNLFIASRSLGVFLYTKTGNGYKFTQLTFE